VEAWCAGQAAIASGMVTTALHQLGSVDDHLFQLQDFSATVLVCDAKSFGERAQALAARHPGLQQVYTLADADFGTSLATAIDRIGHASMRDL
jgi:fatty-acyl-CoA synthase